MPAVASISTPRQSVHRPLHVTIAGAGWAGLAAAVRAVQLGHRVTLLEAARQPGGRARNITLSGGMVLDCGQHILIGAYSETLNLLRTIGVSPQTAFTRQPLDLRTPDGAGLQLPPASALPQWDVVRGVLRARGWSATDKARLLAWAGYWTLRGFRCAPEQDVAALCRPLGETLMRTLITPLCISAFNSAPASTSAQVFLRVLHDALFLECGGSDVLIAHAPLGDTLALPALQWLREHGADVRLGQRLLSITPVYAPDATHSENVMASVGSSGLAHDSPPAHIRWHWHTSAQGADDRASATSPSRAHCASHTVADADMGSVCDVLLLACPAWEAARIVRGLAQQDNIPSTMPSLSLDTWADRADTLEHHPIATFYAWAPVADCAHLPPMQALHDQTGDAAQFVFHHPQRLRQQGGTPQHLLAFVASAAHRPRTELQAAITQQAQQQLGLYQLDPVQTVVEKRATFLCRPALQRPPMHIAPGLLACADYVEGIYPATLEGAVRNGRMAVEQACAAITL